MIVARAIAGVLTIKADGLRDWRLLLGDWMGSLGYLSFDMLLTEVLVTYRNSKPHHAFV